jgi:hypothetical protein
MKRVGTFAVVAVLSMLVWIESAPAIGLRVLPPAPAAAVSFSVVPFEFDPFDTRLVAALWKGGIGCPTNATWTPDGTTFNPYSDPACLTGDSGDMQNQGLLLAKTGPTENFASAGAELPGTEGIILTELGYDLRKPGVNIADPRGSWCGAGAPRFNVTINGVEYFVGCASSATPPATDVPGNDWQRLTWGGTAPLIGVNSQTGMPEVISGRVVECIQIIFDEGETQFGAPLGFGLAVLDNINVNGTRVGRAP